MSQESWVIIGTGFVLFMGLGSYLRSISEQLQTLIEMVHRIRINDRDRDF